MLHFDSVLRDEKISLDAFTTPLTLLSAFVEQDASGALLGTAAPSLFPYIYLFAFLLPNTMTVDPEQQNLARGLWDKWQTRASGDVKTNTLGVIKHLLRELLVDCRRG